MMNGILEIIGPKEFETLFPAFKIGNFHRSDKGTILHRSYLAKVGSKLEASHGERSSKGIMQRAGRSSFKELLRKKGDAIGLSSVEFRFLPTKLRITKGLAILADTLKSDMNCDIQLGDEKDCWLWEMGSCPECKDRVAETPLCYFFHGILFEFFYWFSNGKIHPVSEIECRATGGKVCKFQINKEPLVQ